MSIELMCRGITLALAGLAAVTLRVGAQTVEVDLEALRAAPAEEWLTYGRDHSETHHSPLRQIRRENVSQLQAGWSLEVGSEDRVEATPLYWNGTLYATTTWSVVFAVDALTGEEKWRWDPGVVRGGRWRGGPSVCCGPVNRGVALYRGKIYVGTLDGRLAALGAETGRIVWVIQTTPRELDYSITGAPRIVKGMVIIGNGGSEFPVRGYITAYDAETGDQIWRFYTVPGDPSQPFENETMRHAATTWSGEWWKSGGGGTAWDGMAYDAESDLLYVGTGNGSPWNHYLRSNGVGDNLYLASILALRPDTGELVWYYQTVPGDTWDYTAVQPLVLADLVIDGQARKVIMQAPKNGFFYVLDRITGELISADEYGDVTWATGVDLATGRPIEAPNARYYNTERPVAIYPGPYGAHNWHPMSFNPEAELVYIPGHAHGRAYQAVDPADFTVTVGSRNSGVVFGPEPAGPDVPEREFLLAWDPVAQTERWRITFDSGMQSPLIRQGGTLSTAGGLVFYGNEAGRFSAYDAETGEELWYTQLYPGVATPISYEIDGVQYISVLSGNRSDPAHMFTFSVAPRF